MALGATSGLWPTSAPPGEGMHAAPAGRRIARRSESGQTARTSGSLMAPPFTPFQSAAGPRLADSMAYWRSSA